MINYASFAVAYLRGEMEGQDKTRDMFNKRISTKSNTDKNHIRNHAHIGGTD
jgi:hypothetical protein